MRFANVKVSVFVIFDAFLAKVREDELLHLADLVSGSAVFYEAIFREYNIEARYCFLLIVNFYDKVNKIKQYPGQNLDVIFAKISFKVFLLV